jgi:DNA-directed RNA polymerase sigma subunit (sigma70/sigma32)
MKSKRQRMEEGLVLCRAFMQKHHIQSVPRQVIALWCGCTSENVRQVEERALRKLRRYDVFKQADLDWLCHIVSRHYKVEL